MITKNKKAVTAYITMEHLAKETPSTNEAMSLYFWAGLFKGYANVSGYLSSNDIENMIIQAKNAVPSFGLAYEKELHK